MQKKKILVTASTFPRWEGDTEPRFVYDLAEALADRYDITVLVPAAIGAKDREDMGRLHVVRYHYFPIHKWETLCYPGAIVPRIKEKKVRILLVPCLLIALFTNIRRMEKEFDMVHAHWIIPQGLVQCLFHKPYLVTGHGGDVTSLNQGLIKKWKQACLKNASYRTAVSQRLRKNMQELCDFEDVDVISMGCDTDKFSKNYCVPNFFNQREKKVVLFVGRLAEKKGVSYLIEAMKMVEALLVIVGKGPLEQKLYEQASSMKDKVLFLGDKTHEELKTIYASADIFAAPSVTAKDGDVEGFGLVILEAMASSLPVVASRSGGIVDLVQDGRNGLLCPEKDVHALACSINTLISDENKYNALSMAALNTAKEYDYKKKAEEYANVYEKIMRTM